MSGDRTALILRRFVKHLRAKDWTVALIELVLVVLGVFLGFQLTQWNEDRNDRAREQVYLLNVAEDLRDDVGEMDEISRTAASRMAALSLVLKRAGSWNPPGAFPSSRYSIKVEQVPVFDESRGYTIGIETFILSTLDGNRFAYNTLINADGLGVIRDRELVREIQEYYASVDKVLSFETSLEEDRARLVDALQEAGLSSVGGASFDQVAQLMRERPSLNAAVENYWLYANRQVFLTNKLSNDAERLAGKIESSNED
jgi:hypothetical protein